MARRRSLFHACRGTIFNFQIRKSGITLLLVILVLAALMTISLGIFNIIFTQLQISGELSRSFRALYASDQGLEYALYRDLVLGDICPMNSSPDAETPCPGGALSIYLDTPGFINCFTFGYLDSRIADITVIKFGGQSKIKSVGHSDCTSSFRTVKRAFQIIY